MGRYEPVRTVAASQKCSRERDRLDRQYRKLIEQREEHTKLVEYVEEEREVQRYRARRQRMVDQAGAHTRLKWWWTGIPVDDDRGE